MVVVVVVLVLVLLYLQLYLLLLLLLLLLAKTHMTPAPNDARFAVSMLVAEDTSP